MKIAMEILHPDTQKVFGEYIRKECSPHTICVEVKSVSRLLVDGTFICAIVYSEELDVGKEGCKCEKLVFLSNGEIHNVIFPWPWMGFINTILPVKGKGWVVVIKSDQREKLKINLRKAGII